MSYSNSCWSHKRQEQRRRQGLRQGLQHTSFGDSRDQNQSLNRLVQCVSERNECVTWRNRNTYEGRWQAGRRRLDQQLRRRQLPSCCFPSSPSSLCHHLEAGHSRRRCMELGIDSRQGCTEQVIDNRRPCRQLGPGSHHHRHHHHHRSLGIRPRSCHDHRTHGCCRHGCSPEPPIGYDRWILRRLNKVY